jgi:C4-dicarboxylate-binding protein DctP
LAEATEYFNAIAKKENDGALEDIKKMGKVQVDALTPQERRSWVEAVLPVHKDREAHRQGHHRSSLQGG